MTPPAVWRNLTAADIDSLMRVADSVHPSLPESAEVFSERAELYPDGCLALVNERDELCGYAISHPIRNHQPPALDALLGEIPADADRYYIHDMAILPEFRGGGLAAKGIGRLLDLAVAKGFPGTCLVSVYGTEKFWARFGFGPEEIGDDLREKLKGYGDDAVYLSRANE
ncbi:GNAT family N-acetyltransferase [Aspergillus lucknowensis]|uniref:Acyl-CoA N-acyltransferase n=1 Tax=Aspergillus lucknowensis TaxID=176173 RepID=A0ABR4M3M9_9EURO